MPFRITNQMMFNNSLVNIFRQNEDMLKFQEQLASGKRINQPSDDPLGMMEVLDLRSQKTANDQYLRNGTNITSRLNQADSLLDRSNSIAVRGKELALGQVGALSTAQSRATTAVEVDQLIQDAINVGNEKTGSRFLFGGLDTATAPVTSQGGYVGSSTRLKMNISSGNQVDVGVLASEFLTADLNPALNSSTSVADLHKGAGVGAGTFSITDRAGTAVNVTVSAGDTIGNVINAINASGANVTAAISADGSGISITDNNATPIQNLTITDVSGTAAADLGIAGDRPIGSFTGDDLDPVVQTGTLLSSLLGGSGLTPGSISVVNGAASATVTFAGATTVGDLINAINASGINVTAGIDSSGTRLTLASNSASTVAYAHDIGGGRTAENLGIGGGKNLILNLQRLSAALKANDTAGILGAIDNLGTGADTIQTLRGDVGARTNQVQQQQSTLEESQSNIDVETGQIEGADIPAAASNLALVQAAYQATLKTTASIIQPTLLDFLR